jgi:hypothetical protein
MDNLFSEDPLFRRVQYKKLSDNVREWQYEIAGLVAERLPKNMGLNVTVVFQTVNDEKGYAQGVALAKNADGRNSIAIPLIVKSWHLAPIDLFFKGNKLYHLTEENIARVFFDSSVGASLAPKRRPVNLADDTFAEMRNPPLGGKYSYSTPISELVKGTLGVEDIRMLKAAAMANPNAVAAIYRKGSNEPLDKLAAEKPKVSEQDELNKERTLGIFTAKKDGPGAYRLYSSTDEVFDPVIISTDRQGLKHFLDMRKAEFDDIDGDPMTCVDRYGHFTKEPPKSPYGEDVDGPAGKNQLGPRKNPWVFDPRQDDRVVKTIETFGRYGVRDVDGVLAKGWVMPNVVDFDGNAKPMKLFLSKSLASIQGRVAGIPMPDNHDTFIQADSPETGKLGTMVYRDGKRVLATVPFQVTNVTVYKGCRGIGIIDYKGNQANLILSPNVEGIVRMTDGHKSDMGPLVGPGANYIVSAKMFFVRIPRLCDVSSTPEEFKRIALPHMDNNPIKIAMVNGRYLFRGGHINTYRNAGGRSLTKESGAVKRVSFDFDSLSRHEADFLLSNWGLDKVGREEVLNKVASRIQLEVHHLNFKPIPSFEKKASAKQELDKYARSLRPDMSELVKIAASFEDAAPVDTILSLGFINADNIGRFASAIENLQETGQLVAKLLLASRLGMVEIPEESARTAMIHIDKIVEGLRRLKMRGEEEEKTASPRNLRGHIGGRLMAQTASYGFVR